jgi:two-component system phosphate regulon sensor histidine kinase PhoR
VTRGRVSVAISLVIVVFTGALSLYLKRLDGIILGGATVALIVSWAFIIRATASVTDSLEELQIRLDAVAKGEHNQKISPVPRNELKKVSLAFNKMASLIGDALEQSTAERDRFSIVLSNMADGIFVVDQNLRISLVNQSAQHMFKLDDEKVEGLSFIEAIHDAEMYQLLKQCIESGKQQSGFIETRTRHMYFGVIVTPLQKQGGCILLVQDLTEIRRLETVRRDFVANISHELRTPISSLKALSETLNAGGIEDPSVAREF